jgi:hypothetical protein
MKKPPASALLFQRRTAPLRRKKLSAMAVQRHLVIPPHLPNRHRERMWYPHHPQRQRTTTNKPEELPATGTDG